MTFSSSASTGATKDVQIRDTFSWRHLQQGRDLEAKPRTMSLFSFGKASVPRAECVCRSPPLPRTRRSDRRALGRQRGREGRWRPGLVPRESRPAAAASQSATRAVPWRAAWTSQDVGPRRHRVRRLRELGRPGRTRNLSTKRLSLEPPARATAAGADRAAHQRTSVGTVFRGETRTISNLCTKTL